MLILLLACSRPPAPGSDGLAYAEALDRVAADPAGALDACGPLTDEALRGDCITAGAEAHAEIDAPAAAALCRELAAGLWRDECFFQVAEKSDGAVACDEAGRFAHDCRMHRWGWWLHKGLPAEARPGEVEAALDAQMTEFGLDPATDDPWWAAYRAVLSRRTPLDRPSCDAAPEARLRDTCRAAALQLYGDQLNHVRDTTGFPCDSPELEGRLAYVPDADLDALLARRKVTDLCP